MIPDINKFCQEKFPLVKSIIVFDGSKGLLIDLACFCNPNEAIIGEQEKKCDHMWEGLSQGDIEDEDVNKIRLDKRRQLLKAEHTRILHYCLHSGALLTIVVV